VNNENLASYLIVRHFDCTYNHHFKYQLIYYLQSIQGK